jgi:2-methylcitrate dehydratase PrpD
MPNTSEDVAPGTASERIAHWVSTLRYDELPLAVVKAAKLHALDTVAVAVAAAALPGEAATARAGVAVFASMGGRGEASIIGREELLPAANAAFANASLAHSLDFDDIHTDSRVHASTTVTPAVLAVAERLESQGEDVVAALVAGNEVATRIGMGGPVHFQKHGFHATSVAGVLGVVAATCRLLGLDEEATTRAFGIAADVASGTNAWIARGDATKHLHAGWAAHNGIVSADLAQAGAEGPPGALEGRYGLYEALTGHADVDLSAIVNSLGVEWETPKMAYKAYPSCYWMHGSLDAALEIRAQILGELDSVASMTALVPTPAVAHVLEPRATRIRPLTPYAGKFSLQFSAAAMLLRGRIDLATYTAASMADAEVLDLATRVGYEVSSTFDAGSQLYPGGLRVVMRDGRELVAETPEPRGTELNPMSEAEILDKFRSTARHGLSDEHVADLEDSIVNLEQPDAVTRVGAALRRVTERP